MAGELKEYGPCIRTTGGESEVMAQYQDDKVKIKFERVGDDLFFAVERTTIRYGSVPYSDEAYNEFVAQFDKSYALLEEEGYQKEGK